MRMQVIKKRGEITFNKSNPKNLSSILILSIIIIFAIVLTFFSNRGIIGYITLQKEYSLNYTINKEFTENSEYMSYLSNGDLKSVRLSGKISNGTIARGYIENDEKKYLILNITKITDYKSPSITGSIITGLVIAEEVNNIDNITNQTIILNGTIITNTSINETINVTINQSISKRITINLSYKGETTYDTDNNGVEPITNVIDLTVENSTFNWLVNSSKLCTLWEVYSTGSENKTATCHGSSECCSLKGLLPTRNLWNEPLYLSYGLYGSGYKNIISSKIIHLENDEIVEISSANLIADFIDEKLLNFENICVDTCLLFGFNKSSYKLIIEVEKGKIVLDYLNYIVRQLVYNTPPILVSNFSNFTVVYGDTLRINLSNYFNDSDGDLLSYNYYNSNKYSVNISDRIAEITPNTTGVIYTYFIANDFASISLSNIFVIDVTTMNISQDVGSIIQLNAEINKPVSWIKKVEGNETKIDIPNDAFNISVEKILDNKK
ncbi:MAG: hypothetical protein AABX98_03745, partial [Nanoarchaeota archaeon]